VPFIDPRQSIVAAIEARLSEVRGRARPRAPTSAPSGPVAEAGASAVNMAQRIAAIDRADPDRRRKAVRVVLEAELARAFGAALLNDPGWPAMLDAVQAGMQADAQAAHAVAVLGEWLLARPA